MQNQAGADESFQSNIKKYLDWDSIIARDLEELLLS
jgi:hypothetical protein